MNKENIISHHLLHKSSTDDVLLVNPRKVLPSHFLSSKLTNGSEALSDRLTSLYKFDESRGYIIREISKDINVSGITFSEVISHHRNDKSYGVPYQVAETLIKTLNSEFNDKCVLESKEIEAFLLRNSISRCSTSFLLVNNADHYFFYRKQHEHIPGIMFMEAARQAIYYQLYSHSDHVLGKVTVSLSEMTAKFYAYGELMYPVEIVVDDLTEDNSLLPRQVHYSTSFYQRGALIARIETLAPVIEINKFKLARNALLLNDDDFTPLSHSPVIALTTDSDMTQTVVTLKKISQTSCVTSRPRSAQLSQCLTVIYDETLSFSTTIYKINEDRDTIVWSFEQVNFDELEKLKEMIKRGFISCVPNTLDVK